MNRARMILVLLAAMVAVMLMGEPASSQQPANYPPGWIYRCGGTGFLHVTRDVEDSNCQLVNLASSDVTGSLPPSKGGTGVASPGASGNVLTSTGSAWVSHAPAAVTLAGDVIGLSSATKIVAINNALVPSAPGVSGNVLTSDGTNWISAPTGAIPITKPFVSMADWGQLISTSTSSDFTSGSAWLFTQAYTITGFRFFISTGLGQALRPFRIDQCNYDATGCTNLTTESFTRGSNGSVQEIHFSAPQTVTPGLVYILSYYLGATHWEHWTNATPTAHGPTAWLPLGSASGACVMWGYAIQYCGTWLVSGNASPNTNNGFTYHIPIEPILTGP